MRHALAALLLCTHWAWGASNTQAQPWVVNTVEHYPYQFMRDGHWQGPLAQTLRCISQHQPELWRIERMPWSRALHNFYAGKAQALYPVYAPINHALLSPPIGLERWQWFSRLTDTGNRPDYGRIGAVRGSNEEKWLQTQGYSISMRVNQLEQLLRLLSQHRIDSFVADLVRVQALASRNDIDTRRWRSWFIRFSPLFLAYQQQTTNNPAELSQSSIQCAQSQMVLTPDEEFKLVKFTRQLQPTLNRLALPALKSPAPTESDIAQREAQWQSTELEQNPHLNQTLVNDLIHWLPSHPAVREVIVMGTQGETLASYPKTSDYWQGDEDKWRNSQRLNAHQFNIEPIAYDQSTGEFISHISWRIRADSRAVITLGVDIEQILRAALAAGQPNTQTTEHQQHG